MRKCILSAVVLLVFAGVIFAQEADRPRGDRRRDRPEGGDRMANMRKRLQEQLNLTEDQQKQFNQIMETQRQAVQNWQKENGEALKDLQKQMRAAMEAKDRDKAQSIREKMKKLYEGRREIQEGLTKRLGDVLTEEQMATYKKTFGRRPGGGGEGAARHPILRTLMMLRAAELTPQQQKKVKEALDQTMKKIMNDILTPEQRKKLKDMEKRGEGDRPNRGERGGDRGGARDRPRRGEARRPRGGDPDTVKVAPAE